MADTPFTYQSFGPSAAAPVVGDGTKARGKEQIKVILVFTGQPTTCVVQLWCTAIDQLGKAVGTPVMVGAELSDVPTAANQTLSYDISDKQAGLLTLTLSQLAGGGTVTGYIEFGGN